MTVVIDTNVLLVANGSHKDISKSCRESCIKLLYEQTKNGTIVIDDKNRILQEYQRKTHPNQPRGVGDAFLKWLLQNKNNSSRVHQVALNETKIDFFSEFPVKESQHKFDPPDRKFVAVSNAHPDKPAIWQAADCKWLDWWEKFSESGIDIKFICLQDTCSFYRKKFPKKSLPKLPKP